MIIILESATKVCSVVAVTNDKTVIVKEETGEGFVHSERLAVLVDELLQSVGEELSAIAVSKGPGSYTGLRIGVSVAKGLAFAKNVPLISFCGLQAMASQTSSGYSFAAIDARRNEVFGQLLLNGEVVKETWAEDFDSPSEVWKSIGNNKVALAGDCTEKVRVQLEAMGIAVEDSQVRPSAQHAVEQVLTKVENKTFEDTAYFVPQYLKDFMVTLPKK